MIDSDSSANWSSSLSRCCCWSGGAEMDEEEEVWDAVIPLCLRFFARWPKGDKRVMACSAVSAPTGVPAMVEQGKEEDFGVEEVIAT